VITRLSNEPAVAAKARQAVVALQLMNRDGVKFICGFGTAAILATQSLSERQGVMLFNTSWGKSSKGPQFPLTYQVNNTPVEVTPVLAKYIVDNHPQAKTMIGANGAGKSTVIRCIAGLLKPSAGTVRVFGEDVTGRTADRIVQHGVSVVPEGRRLFSEMTFRENLELGAYTRNDPVAVRRDMERVLALFPDLRDRQGTIAGTFSGGQQQMVAVARALMSAPKIMVLDEPTIGLGPVIVDRISDLIREICKSGVDILLVEQNAEVALSLADRAYILEGGQVIAEDSAKVLVESEKVQKAYLGI
jgi:branched-chain amino acid transport system ATP-binding protein